MHVPLASLASHRHVMLLMSPDDAELTSSDDIVPSPFWMSFRCVNVKSQDRSACER